MHRRASSRLRLHRWAFRLFLAALTVLVGLAAVAVITGRYQVRPLLSGSMEPGLPTGGVVITERVPTSSLRVRDVVVIHKPNRSDELVVHRIISLSTGSSGVVVKTQGDANAVADPWGEVTLRGPTAYRAVYALPWLGYVSVWVHGRTGRTTFMAVGVLLVLAAAAGGMVERRCAGRVPDDDERTAPTDTTEAERDGGAPAPEREPDASVPAGL